MIENLPCAKLNQCLILESKCGRMLKYHKGSSNTEATIIQLRSKSIVIDAQANTAPIIKLSLCN